MRAAFAATLGALLMAAVADPTPADGQEKKDPALKAPFDQFVKVEGKDAKGDPFVKEQVPAYRPATKAPIWRVSTRKLDSGFAGSKDVIVTDKDGKKYPIEKISSGMGYLQLWIASDAKP